MANDITAIKNQVLAIHWHHQIDLGNGIVTPLVSMLKTVGFKRIEVVAGTRSLLFRLLKAIFYKYKTGHSFWSTLQSDRVVIHAYK